MEPSPKCLPCCKRGAPFAKRWALRALRCALIASVLATCLYWFRVPILRSVAAYLVTDEPSPVADYILILPGGDRRYDRAAQLYHAGSATAILFAECRPGRLERMGLEPSFETVSRRELASRGVPANAVTVIPGEARTDWERARNLRDWLRQQPDVRVLVFCDRFGGRKFRYIFDSVLGAELAGRVRPLCLPERTYDENDWWQHREAIVYLFDAYVNLGYTRLCGEDSEEWREWDPQEFKKTLSAQR